VNGGFRDRALARALVRAIRREVETLGRPVTLMEVCGTHTVAISRSGIRDLLEGYVDLRSGPGCPVCVTDQADIDRMVALAALPGTTVLTYGDMLRVPGRHGTLEQARAAGADVRVVYSAAESVGVASADRSRRFVFLGVGFETTAPGAALAVTEAARLGLENFLVFSAHKLLPPALRALLGPKGGAGSEGRGDRPARAQARISRTVEGFLLPGHVSAVIGRKAYDFLAEDFALPGVIAGFEPVDVLLAVKELVRVAGVASAAAVTNLYQRVVREEGNPRARAIIDEVFEPCPAAWRGLGSIEGSGLAFRSRFADFDATLALGRDVASALRRLGGSAATGRPACCCGSVLRGDILPPDCPLFGRTCTPGDPAGPCMVSSEGSCAAYYGYEGRRWAS
jgi:hydrogenase expression/formation protein HypD